MSLSGLLARLRAPANARRGATPAASIPKLTVRAAGDHHAPSTDTASGPEVLSGPEKLFPLSNAQTRYCVVVRVTDADAGDRVARAYVQHHYLTNHDLMATLDRSARANGYKLLPPEPATPDEIRAHYRTSAEGRVGGVALDRMRGRVLDIVAKAARVRTSDIDIVQEGETCEVTFLLNGFKTPPIDRFDKADVPNFFSAAFNLGDHGDTTEIPHLDQKWTCTNTEVLPAGVHGLRFNSGKLANGRTLNVRINYTRLPNGQDGVEFLRLPAGIESRLRTLLFETSGLFSISGPTESGKTTTQTNFLLSMLKVTNHSVKILSIADPPEGIYKGIWQFSIDEETDQRGHLVIERLVQTSLRMSPHYINFGEVRTHNMAEWLFVALSMGKGLLVTVHTFNGLDVPRRYAKLGVHPDDAFDPTNHAAIMNQRLVPHLCQTCRISLVKAAAQDATMRDVLAQWRAAIGDRVEQLHIRGPGCPDCMPPGAITLPGLTTRDIYPEIVDPDEALFDTLRHRPLLARRQWLANDGKSMRLYGLHDLLEGRIGATEFTQFFQRPAYLQYDWTFHEETRALFGAPPALRGDIAAQMQRDANKADDDALAAAA